MGEAKRRKLLGHGFGTKTKDSPDDISNNVLFYNQMIKCLPSGHKPDAGHIHYRMMKDKPFYLYAQNGMIFPDPYGVQYVCVTESEAISILLKKSESKEVFGFIPSKPQPFPQGISLSLKVLPKLRYKSKSGEWVMPFVIDKNQA